MSRNACNGGNGETGEKSPAEGDLNWVPKVAPWRLAILAKMAILAKLAILAKITRGLAICGKIFKLDVQKCMQWRKWRNWRKIASRWRFELDAKSGPLEAGDFGENGDFGEIGKNRHACNGETGEKSPASGDLNWMPKVAPWRLAILAKLVILAKIARGLAICGKIFKLDAKSGPFKVDN